MIKNLVDDKYSKNHKFEDLDDQIEKDLRKQADLSKKVKAAQLMEQLSLNNANEG